MAAFRVTSSELRSKAGELREMNTQFKAQVGNLENQEGSLIAMWEGEARNAFDSAFKNDILQMENFYNLIRVYCESLEMIAAKYDLAESQNASTAQTRSYK